LFLQLFPQTLCIVRRGEASQPHAEPDIAGFFIAMLNNERIIKTPLDPFIHLALRLAF